jgi:hypothetical protein
MLNASGALILRALHHAAAEWTYGIDRFRHGRHGKMDIRKGSSVQSDGIVSTMLWCSANEISAICSIPTKNITMRLVRTYRAPIPRAVQTVDRTLAGI